MRRHFPLLLSAVAVIALLVACSKKPEEVLLSTVEQQTKILKDNLEKPDEAIKQMETYCKDHKGEIKEASTAYEKQQEGDKDKAHKALRKDNKSTFDGLESALKAFSEKNPQHGEKISAAMAECAL